MSSPITPVSAGLTPDLIQAPQPHRSESGFQTLFESAVGKVENLRQTATQGVERFLAGETNELHGTILATQKAELAFELFLQVRNKVVQAYQEIMRMQM